MPIAPRTITVFLGGNAAGGRRAAHAVALARRWGAHLVGIYVVFAGSALHPSVNYARSRRGIAGLVAHESRVAEACERAASQARGNFEALCSERGVSGEFRAIESFRTSDAAIMSALHSDLVVIGHPEPSGLPDHLSAEGLQLACGVPLLIVPNDWGGDSIGGRVLIAWNASPQARRSISDAMTFLVAANSVAALVVDPGGCKWLGRDHGWDISLQLGRHGVQVDVEDMASGGLPIAKVILRRAVDGNADLLVIGAQNSSSLKAIFAGRVARALLANISVPILVSR